jgi:hypothetical protein
MPFKLTFFFLILSNYSFSQVEVLRSPTKFDKFITHDKIQWAAYANDVISFEKFNLSDELYKRFQKGDIKISEPVSRESLMAGNKIIYLNKKELELKSFAPGSDINSKPTNRVDSNSSLLNVTQILYVANGKLHSYVPWVSPLISIYTSQNLFIGTSEYFSSCINNKYNFKSSKRDKVIYLTTTKRKIVIDSLPRTDMLKQFYGINMLEAFWKDLMNEKNEFTNFKNNKKVSQEELKRYNYPNNISIPVYDAEGRILEYQSYSEPISPALFQQIEISQAWYYNQTKNIVLNTITGITLLLKNKEIPYNEELQRGLKITFK